MNELKKEIIAALSDRQGQLSHEPITGETLAQRQENFFTRDLIRSIFDNHEK